MEKMGKHSIFALILTAVVCLTMPATTAVETTLKVDGVEYTKTDAVDGVLKQETWSYDFRNRILLLSGYTGGTIILPESTGIRVQETSQLHGSLEVPGTCVLQVMPSVTLEIAGPGNCLHSDTLLLMTAPDSVVRLHQQDQTSAAVEVRRIAVGGSGQLQIAAGEGVGIRASEDVALSQKGKVEIIGQAGAVACDRLLISDSNESFTGETETHPSENLQNSTYLRFEPYPVGTQENGEILVKAPNTAAWSGEAILACYGPDGRMLGYAEGTREKDLWHFPDLELEGNWTVFFTDGNQPAVPKYEIEMLQGGEQK